VKFYVNTKAMGEHERIFTVEYKFMTSPATDSSRNVSNIFGNYFKYAYCPGKLL
jgi:hypothetical protein